MNPCFGAKWEVPPRAECILAHQRELPEGDRGHGLVAALQPQQLRGGVGGGGDVLAFSTADAADFVRRLDDTSDRIRREEHFLLVLSSFSPQIPHSLFLILFHPYFTFCHFRSSQRLALNFIFILHKCFLYSRDQIALNEVNSARTNQTNIAN